MVGDPAGGMESASRGAEGHGEAHDDQPQTPGAWGPIRPMDAEGGEIVQQFGGKCLFKTIDV